MAIALHCSSYKVICTQPGLVMFSGVTCAYIYLQMFVYVNRHTHYQLPAVFYFRTSFISLVNFLFVVLTRRIKMKLILVYYWSE